MGREIRRVPADWEHPRYTKDTANRREDIGHYMTLHDNDYDTAAEKWLAGLASWETKPESEKYGCRYYWEYDSPPDRKYYRERKWSVDEATHYQMYQTVSEGTPLTPPMPSLEALADYLVEVGDDWDGKWTRAAAERFVRDQYAPSLMIIGNAVYTPATMPD